MTPRYVHLFGLRAGRTIDRSYTCSVGQVLYSASANDAGQWSVSINDADSFPHLASCWAVGHGETIEEAETMCERALKRDARRRAEVLQEIAERRRCAA